MYILTENITRIDYIIYTINMIYILYTQYRPCLIVFNSQIEILEPNVLYP